MELASAESHGGAVLAPIRFRAAVAALAVGIPSTLFRKAKPAEQSLDSGFSGARYAPSNTMFQLPGESIEASKVEGKIG